MKTVILNFGYAEDAFVSQVTMSTYFMTGGQEAPSVQDGMLSLALDFYYYSLNMAENPTNLSCDDFRDFSKMLCRQTHDECYWEERWSYLSDSAPEPIWSPFWSAQTLPDLTSGNFIYIPERAEDVLLDLVLQQMPSAFFNAQKYHILNIQFTDADLGKPFNVPWGKF